MGLKFDGKVAVYGNSKYILIPALIAQQLGIDREMLIAGDALKCQSGVINLKISIYPEGGDTAQDVPR